MFVNHHSFRVTGKSVPMMSTFDDNFCKHYCYYISVKIIPVLITPA